MNHFPPRRLKPHNKKDKTWVVWSRQVPRNAIVFVHGYMGNAITTWSMFESMLPLRPKAKDYDLFFYGYDCVTSNTTAQGRLLCDFLHKLWTSPGNVARDSLPSATDRTSFPGYQRVVVVGHSIGGIVCRRALLFAKGLKYGWMPATKMVLFAPAHNGAKIYGLLAEMPWLNLVTTPLVFFSPLIKEVDPRSPSIKQLYREVVKAVRQGATYLKAEKVVVAATEWVVDNVPFPVDPVPEASQGTTHRSVCKPSSVYSDPVDHVEDVM